MNAKTLCAILVLTATMALQTLAQSYLTNGLVAYYPFCGNLFDASGNGNNGTLIGGVTYGVDRFGSNNSCIYMSGTAGVSGGVDIPSLASTPYLPATYSAWFWISNFPPTPGFTSVMSLVGREQCGDDASGAVCIFSQPGGGTTNKMIYYSGGAGYTPPAAPPPINGVRS